MSKYQDSIGGWNAKPVREGLDKNLFTYGMYADILGLDTSNYKKIFEGCKIRVDEDFIEVHRRPGQPRPPISPEEFIGMLYFSGKYGGFVDYDSAKGNHFFFLGHGKPLRISDIEKLVKAIMKLVVAQNINIFMSGKKKIKQRNLWWRHNIEEAKHFAGRLSPAYVYIIKKYFRRDYHIEEEKLWAFYRDCTTKNKSNSRGVISQKNLLWALHIMNGDENRARKLKPWVNFEKYFGKHHDFTIAIKRKYGV